MTRRKIPNPPKEKGEFCQINTLIRLAAQLPDLTRQIQLGHAARDKGWALRLAFSVTAYTWTELR